MASVGRKSKKEYSSPQEIVKQIGKLTSQPDGVVLDILDAFVDVATTEVILKGMFSWPKFIIIERNETSPKKRYIPSEDATIEIPEYRVSSRVSKSIKNLSKEYVKNILAKEANVDVDNWWKPYFISEGNTSNFMGGLDKNEMRKESEKGLKRQGDKNKSI